MSPLSNQIWICVILVYIGVCTILFLVSHFSPYEWHFDDDVLKNDFTILNTMWFSLAAMMQQGVDIAPRYIFIINYLKKLHKLINYITNILKNGSVFWVLVSYTEHILI